MNEKHIKTSFEMQPSWRGADYPMFKSGYLCALQQMNSVHTVTDSDRIVWLCKNRGYNREDIDCMINSEKDRGF